MLTERDFGEFKRGTLDILILWLLRDQDMYVYQLSQDIEKRSGGDYPISDTVLFSALFRLAKGGYVTKRKETNVNRPRSFYHLESSGVALLDELLLAYKRFHRGMKKIIGKEALAWEDPDEQ